MLFYVHNILLSIGTTLKITCFPSEAKWRFSKFLCNFWKNCKKKKKFIGYNFLINRVLLWIIPTIGRYDFPIVFYFILCFILYSLLYEQTFASQTSPDQDGLRPRAQRFPRGLIAPMLQKMRYQKMFSTKSEARKNRNSPVARGS